MSEEQAAPLRPFWADEFGQDRFGYFGRLPIRGIKVTMRYIPPGEFVMGGKGHLNGSLPHSVTIEQGFWLLETPVTRALYKAVMGHDPSFFTHDTECPVESVSWVDCNSFMRNLEAILLERHSNHVVRAKLPSEEEWEYAARAGSQNSIYATDAQSLEDIAWVASNAQGRTQPVGQKIPNAFGLHDMLGNVFEWTNTSYESYATKTKRLRAKR